MTAVPPVGIPEIGSRMANKRGLGIWFGLILAVARASCGDFAFSDGIVVAPGKYKGSLQEKSLEAIIIFEPSERHGAIEHLIIKIRVEGDVDHFA